MKKHFLASLIAILVSSLIFGPVFAASEIRKLGEYDLSWGPYGTTWTSSSGKAVRYLPRYFSSDAFTDGLTLYGNDLITKGPWVDVRAFGASTSASAAVNNAAFQAAIDNVRVSGGTVFIPDGQFNFTAGLDFTNSSYVRFVGNGMRRTILQFSGLAGHGIDATGADHFEIENMRVAHSGGTPKAGLLLARSNSAAGGFNHFSRFMIDGTWEVGIYSYGSELNSYEHCYLNGKVGYFINAGNPLGYTSAFSTIATGGQSNTYGSWFFGWINSSGTLSATYDAALVLDDAASWSFYTPFIGARAATVGNNVQFRSTPRNISFYSPHLENAGAIGFLVDNTSVTNLKIDTPYIAGEAAGFKLVGKSSAGSVSGLEITRPRMTAGANLATLDTITSAILDSAGAYTVSAATRFDGIVLNGIPTAAGWSLPAAPQTQAIITQSQGRIWIIGRPRFSDSPDNITNGGYLTAVAGISGNTDYSPSRNLRGTVTFSTSGTKAVSFPVNEDDASYRVALSGSVNETFWVTSKGGSGFTLNSSNASSTAIVDWIMIR
mgnify:CR=1 FL=1